MNDFVTNTMDSLGYFGILALMVLENVVPPIPSEVVMTAAGASARSGDESLWLVIVVGTIGSVLGTLPWYGVAKLAGTERLVAWTERHGHWIGATGKDIRKADAWFDRYGGWAVFLCRMIPGVRTLISVPAGFSEMSFRRFLLYTTVGTAIWCGLLATAGYWLKGQSETVVKTVEWIGMGAIAALTLLFLARIVRVKIARARQQAG